MQKIELRNTLPAVFAGREKNESEVWLKDLTLERGRFYLIAAESGTGKSSLCSFLYGNRIDYSGTIAFDGQDIRSFSIDHWCDLRRNTIAYLPQDMRLFPELSAIDNIRLKNSMTGHKSETQIDEMLDRLGIADKRDSLVAHLSIGQQQRVAIIRTLCQKADFFLLDEPVSHLDEANNRIVAEMVTEEARKQGAAIIATSVGNDVAISVDTLLRL